MADVQDVDDERSDETVKRLCKSCNRGVKSAIECVTCGCTYHPSCIVRVKGVKVVDFNKVTCASCTKEDDEDIRTRILRENSNLNKILIQMMENQEIMKDKIDCLEKHIHKITSNKSLNAPENAAKTVRPGVQSPQLHQPTEQEQNPRIPTHRSHGTKPSYKSMLVNENDQSTGRRRRNSSNSPNPKMTVNVNENGTGVNKQHNHISNEANNSANVINKERPKTSSSSTDTSINWKIASRKKKVALAKVSKGNENLSVAMSKLQTVERKEWIFISNLNSSVEESDILECLNEYSTENYVCKKLIPKNEHSKIASFRIGVPNYLVNIFKSLTFWPKGTYVDTYHFRPMQNHRAVEVIQVVDEASSPGNEQNFQKPPANNVPV